jgi:hypothetical protein
MDVPTNMDRFDRLLRGVAGIWLLAISVSAARSDRRFLTTTTAIAGVGLLLNAVSGFCGGNFLLDVDTTSNDG